MTPSVGELRRLVEEATKGPVTGTRSVQFGAGVWFGSTLRFRVEASLDDSRKGADGLAQWERDFAYAVTALDALPALLDRLEKYEAALKEIADPVAHMRAMAEAEGAIFNPGIAIAMSKDAPWLSSVARAALASAALASLAVGEKP